MKERFLLSSYQEYLSLNSCFIERNELFNTPVCIRAQSVLSFLNSNRLWTVPRFGYLNVASKCSRFTSFANLKRTCILARDATIIWGRITNYEFITAHWAAPPANPCNQLLV